MKKHKKTLYVVLLLALTFSFIPTISSAYVDPDNKEIVEKTEKEIYLTFDDGPGGKVTEEVLDTLKSNDVKATFFLIGNQIKGQEALLKRMVNEGHSLGLHSMTHNRELLYSSNDGFINEMKQVQDKIYEATNVKTNILRFPFGCNNSTYRLKHSLVDAIHNNGMRIYDWTLDSGDGANANASPSTFIRKSCSSEKEHIVLLMHCGFINKNSAKSLDSIIKHYKSKGYTFKVITDETPEVYHFYQK
ncbi:MAG: polysaccharide deacetylase family protein [Clostridium sp.]